MLSVKYRLKKLEDTMRRARQRVKLIVVFSSTGIMKVVGGDIDRSCPTGEGELLLSGIDQDCTVIRFNIPRPGMINYFKELEE